MTPRPTTAEQRGFRITGAGACPIAGPARRPAYATSLARIIAAFVLVGAVIVVAGAVVVGAGSRVESARMMVAVPQASVVVVRTADGRQLVDRSRAR